MPSGNLPVIFCYSVQELPASKLCKDWWFSTLSSSCHISIVRPANAKNQRYEMILTLILRKLDTAYFWSLVVSLIQCACKTGFLKKWFIPAYLGRFQSQRLCAFSWAQWIGTYLWTGSLAFLACGLILWFWCRIFQRISTNLSRCQGLCYGIDLYWSVQAGSLDLLWLRAAAWGQKTIPMSIFAVFVWP